MGWQEQVCRRHHKKPHGYETWLKAARARAERRRARQAAPMAGYTEAGFWIDFEWPRRRFRGYSD